jgi:hypothetical protein
MYSQKHLLKNYYNLVLLHKKIALGNFRIKSVFKGVFNLPAPAQVSIGLPALAQVSIGLPALAQVSSDSLHRPRSVLTLPRRLKQNRPAFPTPCLVTLPR